ncbi:MAG: isocitrate/isopropylmalate family dehydrogenase [Pseudomonadota bacterium]
MSVKLLLLPGDGVGPECAAATAYILKTATGLFALDIEADSVAIGSVALEESGDPLPEATLEALKVSDIAVVGPLADAGASREALASDTAARLIKDVDLYARLAMVRPWAGFATSTPDLDILIVSPAREGADPRRNMTVGSGSMLATEDVGLDMAVASRGETRRLAEAGVALALGRPGPVRVVEQTTVFPMSEGLFAAEVMAVLTASGVDHQALPFNAVPQALAGPGGQGATWIVSGVSGSALTTLVGGVSGSAAMTAELAINDRQAVSLVSGGPRGDIAGRGVSDPVPFILSVARCLDWAGQMRGEQSLIDAAIAIEVGAEAALAQPENRSADLGGSATTAQIAKAVAAAMITAVRQQADAETDAESVSNEDTAGSDASGTGP